jgi:hypothetical protein
MTTNRRSAQTSDACTIDGSVAFLPFLTPVRGHGYAAPPPGDPVPLEPGGAAVLQREQDNPADALAVAVWLTGSGTPWRIGYLERAVAARIAPRLDRGAHVDARLAGWWDEPNGRWQRPVVALEPERIPLRTKQEPGADTMSRRDAAELPALAADQSRHSVWARPPGSRIRPVR